MTFAEEQCAAFVNRQLLPLDPIPHKLLAIILETISSTWLTLVASRSAALSSGDEKNVTALLESSLIHLCKKDPLFGGLVSAVARGVECRNFDFSKIELRPDLSIYLTDSKRPFPLTVECKLIDHPNGKDTGLYCTKGIARFVDGDYAWTNREAIMLAYVRDGSTVEEKLVPHLSNLGKNGADPYLTKSIPQPLTSLHPAVRASEHGRSFSYLSVVVGDDPGPIRLFHLWLSTVEDTKTTK
jgi:hypothetical protein